MEFDWAAVTKERAAGAMAGRAGSKKKDPYGASHEKNIFGYCIFKYIPYICTTKTVCAVMVPENP